MIRPFDLMTCLPAARKSVLLLAISALLTLPVLAQDAAESGETTETDETPSRLDADLTLSTVSDGEQKPLVLEPSEGQVELGYEEAIVQALRHNVSLVVQRYARERSLLGIQEAAGIFDLGLGADLQNQSSSRPTNSELEAADVLTQDIDQWSFEARQLTPWGGDVTLNFSNSRFESTNAFVNPNPQYRSFLQLEFTQPLLRDFGREATEEQILLARRNSSISYEAFRSQVESVIVGVSREYWDLVSAREQLAVALESLELARELHEMNRIQVEVGTKAPLEMVQSEAGVAAREEDIIRRRAAVEDAADRLRRLINLEQEGNLWDTDLVPVTDPEIEHEPIDLPQAVELAIENRPDIVQQRLLLENRELQARVAQRSKLPQVELRAGIGYNGISGTFRLPDETILDQGYGDAVEQVLDREFEDWYVGVTVSYPLQNRTAEARATRAELQVEETEWALRDLEGQVMLEVRQAARAVETAAKAIESAKVSSRLARKNLEAEQKRYENGLSTSFQVLEIQEDLSNALSSEVAAVIEYRKALVAYQQAIGMLLHLNGIVLEEPDDI